MGAFDCCDGEGGHGVNCQFYSRNKPMTQKFECHITVDRPASSEELDLLKRFGETVGWKTSYIQGDPVLGAKAYFYFTRYSTNSNKLTQEMVTLSSWLEENDIPVIRQKIEEILYDTKTGHNRLNYITVDEEQTWPK